MIINSQASITGSVKSLQLRFHNATFEGADLFLEPGEMSEYAIILSWVSSRVPSGAKIADVVELATRLSTLLGHVDMSRIVADLDAIDDLYYRLGVVVEAEYAVANTGHGVLPAEIQHKNVLLLKTRQEVA